MGPQCLEIAGSYMPAIVDEECWRGADATLAGAQNVFVHTKGMSMEHHVEIETLHV
jgi:hypothetical protein